MDEAAPENKGILRDIGECRQNTDIQRDHSLLSGCPRGTETAAGYANLYGLENPEPVTL